MASETDHPEPGRVLLRLPKPRGPWLELRDPDAVLEARRLSEVGAVLAEASDQAERGRTVAGFVSYEAGPAFDDALGARDAGQLPLAWMGVYRGGRRRERLGLRPDAGTLGEWSWDVRADAHAAAVGRIREYIAAGETYQVNYTCRLRAPFAGRPPGLFAAMLRAQPVGRAAYVDAGRWALCSASPELFFELGDGALICRPMKGTAPRKADPSADARNRRALRRSAKDRAENAMIVDMIRNDLGRVATPGSVRVARAFEVEAYRTVLQMTSTVHARTPAGIPAIFSALFPCASITGAPKVRTSEIIRELELSPRGVYTGSIGAMGPGWAHFNVAIRTAVVDRQAGGAEYGVGGGILWDSDPAAEYAECMTKARVVRALLPDAADEK